MFRCDFRKLPWAVFIFVTIFSFDARSQENPIFSQFFLNPYLLNPAYAGHENQAVIYFSHRQQWTGIEGAPATSLLSFNTPLKNRLSIGTNIMNDSRGLIGTSSAEFTLAYVLPTFKGQYLRFGISGGIGMNRLSLDEVDNPNDPALLGIADNNFYSTAKFGLNYAIKDFNIGAAFLGLLNNNIFSQYDFNRPEVKPLEKYLLMANYNFRLSDNGLALEPHIVYRQFGNSFDQLELLGVLHIQDKVWIGGSYKTDYGFSAFGGLNFMERFSLGYAYEMASSLVNSFSDGTHEFVFSIKIGKKKEPDYLKTDDNLVTKTSEERYEKEVPEEAEADELSKEEKDADELPTEDTTPIAPEDEVAEEEKVQKEATETEPEEEEEVKTVPVPEEEVGPEEITEESESEVAEKFVTVKSGNHPYEMDEGYYVIVGAFKVQDNARNHIQQLIYKGFNSRYGYSSAKGLYYVYVTRTFETNEAERVRDKIRKFNIYQFEDAWILSVVE